MNQDEKQEFSLIADVALLHERKVLLVKYQDVEEFDGQTGWFLPDAAIRYLEHPEKAATRLLREQLGLEPIPLELDHIESFRGRDGSWHLAFHYRSALKKAPTLAASKVIAAQEWFSLDQLPSKDSVAHHGWALSVLQNMEESPS
ncbi:MAG: NUDIX domain-containing protein [Anaerolineales bacterium]